MVQLAQGDEGKALDQLTLTLTADDSSDDESEDESCGLNISCHGSQFRQMVQENKCDSQIVRKRKLQTHLDSLDSELSTLCFTLNPKDEFIHKSKDDDLKECEVSPRTAKIIKRSMEHYPPNSSTRKRDIIQTHMNLQNGL